MSEIRDFCCRYGFETSVADCLDEADQIFQSNPAAMAVLEEQVAVYARDRNFDYHPVFERLHELEAVTGVHKYTIDLFHLNIQIDDVIFHALQAFKVGIPRALGEIDRAAVYELEYLHP